MRIFVAGLSRSGKTSRIRSALEANPAIEYVSVSALLGFDRSTSWLKTVTDALGSQRKAIDALNTRCLSGADYVIDGHVLLETNEAPMIVPDWFFREASLDALLYVGEKPELIYERRLGTNRATTVDEIRCLVAMESAAARRICSKLDFPFFLLSGDRLDRLDEVLRKILRHDQ